MKQLIILALCGYVLGFFHGINSIKKIDTKDFVRCYEMNDTAACCRLGVDISQRANFLCDGAYKREAKYKKEMDEWINANI